MKKNKEKYHSVEDDYLLEPEEIKKQLQTLIDALLECERNNKDCKKCKLRKRGCLKFIRDSVAVALQFILVGLGEQNTQKIETKMYI